MSFAGVLALAVVSDRFAGALSLAAVHTDALNLISAGAPDRRVHSRTGDKQHRHRAGDQHVLRVHFDLLLKEIGLWKFDSRDGKRFHR